MINLYLFHDRATWVNERTCSHYVCEDGMYSGLIAPHAPMCDDVASFPEQVIGRRWRDLGFLDRIKYSAFVCVLSILALGLCLFVSAM